MLSLQCKDKHKIKNGETYYELYLSILKQSQERRACRCSPFLALLLLAYVLQAGRCYCADLL